MDPLTCEGRPSTASGPRDEGPPHTPVSARAESDRRGAPRSGARPRPRLQPRPRPPRAPRPRSEARGHDASQRPGLGEARPARGPPPARPRPAASAREGGRGRARLTQAAAPPARPLGRGAPLAPRTYLRRPRPARAARSPTAAEIPTARPPPPPPPPSRRAARALSSRRDPPAARGERRADLGARGQSCARPPRIGGTAERAAEAANRRRAALPATARGPMARPRGRDQALRPRPR
ncbi:proline-rich protein 2-like [Monodon monoceros]|uniref:proline-rich protein 2-like n=1 Tax=Monodon monoceros TaxID=40151 RepID=UPI0010F51957|nr:proline-rich protein 2-like [Monodon monoceros]